MTFWAAWVAPRKLMAKKREEKWKSHHWGLKREGSFTWMKWFDYSPGQTGR